MDVVYLNVPFKDKDIVKALGARWDGKNKSWFVGLENAERFSRWIKGASASPKIDRPSYASSDPVAVGAELGGMPSSDGEGGKVGASLSSLLFEASEAIRKAMPVSRWVFAEVASIRTHQSSGHTYLELVEHDEAGRELAKASARIWSGSSRVLKRFEKETGSKVVSGMKLLVLVQADFSVQYGFGLTVEDVDPSWTLGEMERKLMLIREKLVANHVFHLNKSMGPVEDFIRVAVVAPDGAAGMGDFMADADVLARHGLCDFINLHAVFEGASASLSLVSALTQASDMAKRGELDAVVVVRGGGAKTSLNWVNDYEVAKLVCDMSVPVMVGIGHERDSTILDEVACESFDTPSKVVGAIVSRICSNAKIAMYSLMQIRGAGREQCVSVERICDALIADVAGCSRQVVALERAKIEAGIAKIGAESGAVVREARMDVESLGREVLGLGPRSVLERGYCVATQDGAVRPRVGEFDSTKPVTLRLADGEVILKMSDK